MEGKELRDQSDMLTQGQISGANMVEEYQTLPVRNTRKESCTSGGSGDGVGVSGGEGNNHKSSGKTFVLSWLS